jgi:hypothetical protein
MVNLIYCWCDMTRESRNMTVCLAVFRWTHSLATRNRLLLENGFWRTCITVSTDKQITTDEPFKCVCCLQSAPGHEITRNRLTGVWVILPFWRGVEYLHRNPPSCRRRWKVKSRVWDNEIWSRVPRDSNLRMTALAKASSNCKRQNHSLVRESAPYQQTRNWLTVTKIWS